MKEILFNNNESFIRTKLNFNREWWKWLLEKHNEYVFEIVDSVSKTLQMETEVSLNARMLLGNLPNTVLEKRYKKKFNELLRWVHKSNKRVYCESWFKKWRKEYNEVFFSWLNKNQTLKSMLLLLFRYIILLN